jgi:hypothetical protein
LLALVRDLFTFSSKVIKKVHNSIKERLNVKKRQETYEKKENKASLGCGLGQQFAFIKKNRVKNMNGQ